jgi:gamma-glutamyltranspeptidase / glutathione hydrolase
MVATSQHLAAQAGLDILKAGGNAVDAAVATAACLTVVEPTSNGIGGDNFALIWHKDKLYGLNSSGPAPRSISIDAVKNEGFTEIPELGWIPVTVPGAPAGWAELIDRFGRLTLKETLRPAIEYAEGGYPVPAYVSGTWKSAYENYAENLKGEQFKSWFETFAPKGRAPAAGEVWRSKDLADTLGEIAETNAQSFYSGALADKMCSFSKRYRGYLRKEDLEAFHPEWVTPISTQYRGYDVWEIPPNGQGLVALIALNILGGFDFDHGGDTDTLHKQIEAVKLAFADGKAFITDPAAMTESVEALLSPSYAGDRRRLIGRNALQPLPGRPPSGGTVYLAAADDEGTMVSFIQSNYMGFGSGLVVPETGISLHNRGHCFSLDPSHPNCLKPGKKTYHTIIPGFLSKQGKAVGPFGVMGGFMQPQGHVQVLMNCLDFGMNPQAALDAPRWQWIEGKEVLAEHALPVHIVRALEERGHAITYSGDYSAFGRGQIIWKDEQGTLIGGTEPRADGAVAAW